MTPLLLLSVLLPAGAQQTRVLTADKSNEYGLVYTLPLTAVEIELTARRTVSQRGPYYQYARKYLGSDRVVTADTESWTLTGARVVTYGVADPETQYLMQFKPGSLASVCVDSNGMLLAINTEADAPASPSTDRTLRREASPHPDPARDYLQYVDQDFVASQSLARQAQMLAESLMEVREAKISLTRGTADTMPTDGRQLELMLASLEKQEEALTAAFTGVTWTETETRRYDAVPEGNGRSVLCRLSDFAGFVDNDDLRGAPVYLEIEIVSEGALPVDSRGEVKKLPKDAIVYNIPGSAQVTLSYQGEEYYSAELAFAQFGVQFGLNPVLFSDKKEPYSAVFDPVTGAVKEVTKL